MRHGPSGRDIGKGLRQGLTGTPNCAHTAKARHPCVNVGTS